ncbi:TrkA C-terminal domain-containing protein [Halodesulfurarchaeum sp. HSR-GB]|uniref:TrkA C-terminal domain-containing protein n=1 Tax=Halodesulfurarchaeum sp. HSR-GB TaxID=3074077 RepID=UPI0028604A53|nr:TrkA C-terminal domain-containing protein [Halodesulfurarchaeum sp. HSR-GB]MDR5656280.1 TrkA C-terminal domain-containing protein [Halodesulfurarchaeum sp. HSR-GB]
MSLAVIELGTRLLESVVHVIGLVLLAGGTTAIAAFAYRIRVRHALPEGVTLILGLGVVALYLNTRTLFAQFVQGGAASPTVGEATLNVLVFAIAALASYGGNTLGDRLARSDRLSLSWLQRDLSPIVRAAGRHISVTLPAEIRDIEGYDPVEAGTKESLEGRTLDFPRGLTVEELRTQLQARLKEKFDVGYVDLELSSTGEIQYLGVAKRPAGIGPTLPPNAAAVAVRADPPFSATAGDIVQLWAVEDGEPRKLGTGELRARIGSIATITTDRAVATVIDPETEYRLLTLAADSRPDREFAAMLRRADETMRLLSVTDSSPLVGQSVAAIDSTVLGIRTAGGSVETIPNRRRLIQPEDELFVIGRPEALRKLEAIDGVQAVQDETVTGLDSMGRPWAAGRSEKGE